MTGAKLDSGAMRWEISSGLCAWRGLWFFKPRMNEPGSQSLLVKGLSRRKAGLLTGQSEMTGLHLSQANYTFPDHHSPLVQPVADEFHLLGVPLKKFK